MADDAVRFGSERLLDAVLARVSGVTERVLLTGRVEDGAAAVAAAAELAAGGVQVVPWLVPGGPRDDDPLLAAARAAADREEAVPRGPAPDRRPETARTCGCSARP